MRRHEIDRIWGHFLSGHDQITFVFAIGIVGYDDQAALRDVAYHIVHRIELKCLRCLCNHRNSTFTGAAALGNCCSTLTRGPARIEINSLDHG